MSAVGKLGGTARWRQLVDMGVPGQALTSAVARGDLLRPHRGCYALPGTVRSDQLETIFRAELTCISWAREHSLPVEGMDQRVHLLVPRGRGMGLERQRPGREVVMHRDTPPGDRDAVAHLDRAASCTSAIGHLALVDAALRERLITRSDLDGLRLSTAAHREWLRTHADARAESLGETAARVALREAGIAVEPQVTFPGIGRVDLLVDGRLVVEIDGWAFHSDPEAFIGDRRRDRALSRRGLTVLRFAHREAVEAPAGLVAEVMGALRAKRAAA